MIALPPNVVQPMLYCTSCHQDVTPVHHNFCPQCSITDSMVTLNGDIAKACRDAQIVNHQKCLPNEVRNAIQRMVARKLMSRMKVELTGNDAG
jgi:hypothetical protein